MVSPRNRFFTMRQIFLSICFLFVGLAVSVAAQKEEKDKSNESSEHGSNFDKNPPEQCSTGISATPVGTCMEPGKCRKIGGTSTARCPKHGTCCLVSRTCGQTTSANNTYFLSPGYPKSFTTGGTCQLTVKKANNNICQVRIDFMSFNLAQPTIEDGVCSTDFMTVTGGTSSNVPVLCGFNNGQHMYVNTDPHGSPLRILVDTNVNGVANRIFNMQISQIPCDSRSLAPSGCLQYFTGTSGVVQSFNFPVQPRTTFRNGVTQQLADTEYTTCVRPESGHCSISWNPDKSFESFGFFISGDSGVIDESLLGNIQLSEVDNCPADYVLVPGGKYTGPNGVESSSDRFCGAAFPDPVTSTFQPFQLFVKTDSSEAPTEAGNFGFSLSFRQNIC